MLSSPPLSAVSPHPKEGVAMPKETFAQMTPRPELAALPSPPSEGSHNHHYHPGKLVGLSAIGFHNHLYHLGKWVGQSAISSHYNVHRLGKRVGHSGTTLFGHNIQVKTSHIHWAASAQEMAAAQHRSFPCLQQQQSSAAPLRCLCSKMRQSPESFMAAMRVSEEFGT